MSNLIENDITTELWREYTFGPSSDATVVRIDNPVKLFMRPGGTTHRILTVDGVVTCVPAPGEKGCVLRWLNKDAEKNPCEF